MDKELEEDQTTVSDVAVEDAEMAEKEAAYERFVWDNLKRNYLGNYLHGMLGMTGFRLVNTPTFVPAYLHSISGSDFWVGIGTSLQQLGGIVSPIIGAQQIEHRKKILPVSVTLGLLMRAQILGLAISGWFLGGWPALAFALLFLFLLGFFQGPQRVAFQLLLAKVIPIRLRGRLQAWRNNAGQSAGVDVKSGHGDLRNAHFEHKRGQNDPAGRPLPALICSM